MSWTDKQSLKTISELRDLFNVKCFIETGTFKAINALVHKDNFNYVFTCENHPEYLAVSNEKLKKYENVYLFNAHSPEFLKEFIVPKFKNKEDMIIIYLDAHFYNPNLPKDKRFVVLEELDMLKEMNNCIIIIHDFDNGKFGHITYDDIPLDFNLVREKLINVNPNFKFYTNNKCDVYNKETIKELIDDPDADGNIEYAHTSVEKRDRGILYCIPKEVNIDGLELIG